MTQIIRIPVVRQNGKPVDMGVIRALLDNQSRMFESDRRANFVMDFKDDPRT